MKTIYFVRHGETDGNTGKVFQGADTPLTGRGLEQAERIADRCARLDIRALISSPMVRAKNTADIIASKIGLPIEVSGEFAERRRPSSIVGLSTDNAEAARINAEWMESLFLKDTRVLDGESFDDVNQRATRALAMLASHSSDNILVVSHGFYMCFLLARIVMGTELTPDQLRKMFDTFQTSNTGLSIIQYQGRWSEWEVLVWNDHAHLG